MWEIVVEMWYLGGCCVRSEVVCGRGERRQLRSEMVSGIES